MQHGSKEGRIRVHRARRWLAHAIVVLAAVAILTIPVAARHEIALGGVGGQSLVIPAMPGSIPVAAQAAPPAGSSLPHMVWPLQGPLTQGFGPSPYWFEPSIRVGGTVYPHFHTGIDLAASWGTPVHAAMAGRVEYAGWQGGYGYTVVLLHDGGLRTLYAHLSRWSVRIGQSVVQGAVIGAAGATGNATGPHLHFEVRTAPQVVVDPMAYLDPAQAGEPRPVPVQWPAAPRG
jgi:murein DD-endopeptidase MepM/ murein hydrolase activator NlpD